MRRYVFLFKSGTQVPVTARYVRTQDGRINSNGIEWAGANPDPVFMRLEEIEAIWEVK